MEAGRSNNLKGNNLIFPLILIFVILLVVESIDTSSARGGIVLFYETNKISNQYSIDSGYSKFKEALEQKGYSVSKVEIDLSKAVLQRYNPDVLVIAGLQTPLSATEQAAVFEFVMQEGKGLFICGGTPAANQLSIPFGMTIDDAPLEDETDPIKDYSTGKYLTDKEKFSLGLDNIILDPTTRSITQGVSQIGFFGGNGIALSGNARAVIVGDWDTYAPKSSTGLFPKGSKPPIAASAIVGNGLVFLLSDADMLLDSNLDIAKYKHDNLRLGTNIVDWLSIKIERRENVSLDELQLIIGGLKQENSRLNDTINQLKSEKNALINDKNVLVSKLDACNEKVKTLEAERFLGVSHLVWAIGILGFAILVAAVVYAKKVKYKGKTELGYEFEEEGAEGEEEKKEGEEEDLDSLDIGGGKFGDLLGEEEKEEESKL